MALGLEEKGRHSVEGESVVGDVQNYEDVYKLCYVRGPAGIIVELGESSADAR